MNKGRGRNSILIIFLISLFIIVFTTYIYVRKENEDTVIVEERVIKSKVSNQEELDRRKENELLILVNRDHGLDVNYVPDDLVVPNIYLNTANNMCAYLREEAARAMEDLFNAAKVDGINLIGISGYRSYDYQVNVYDKSVISEGAEATEKFVAEPGHSEHQTGLSMDILSSEYRSLDEGFENTQSYKWLCDNIAEYGFIIRYPKDKVDITKYDYEPWHLRYVGKEAAKEINEKGITLEEYLGEA